MRVEGGHRPGSRGKPEVAALMCAMQESWREEGEATGVEQGSSQRLQLWGWGRGPHEDSKHLSSEVRKT